MRPYRLSSRKLQRNWKSIVHLNFNNIDAKEALERNEEENQKEIPPISKNQWVDNEEEFQEIDLLNPRKAVIINKEELGNAISFGFAGGDTAGTIRGALKSAPVAASDWEPTCFIDSLFVRDLLDSCMKIRIENFEPLIDPAYLIRLLTHPPKDLETIMFRRNILRELSENRALLKGFQNLYQSLYRLRDLLEPGEQCFELDSSQRRLDTLALIRDTVELMSSAFSESESALIRIYQFSTEFKKNEGYKKLAELLDYDNNLAGVDLRLRIGADGRIRRFEIRNIAENKENQFYQTPIGRWMTRLFLLFRGFFFGEGELVNRWVDSVFDGIVHMLPTFFQLLGEMEFYLSSLAFKELAESKGLSLCFPNIFDPETDPNEEQSPYFKGLFNPLLFGQDITPLPCQIRLDTWKTITIVTGPNSGGKTRLLQAIAITQMLTQCGMYASVKEATLRWSKGLFVSLIEKARADQKEGRLGTELIRIRKLFERARPGYLILLDELCSGTNPSEGEEIFRLVISLLGELQPFVFITTHFLQFAAHLQRDHEKQKGMNFLQVDLDENNYPTYNFINGVATTSLAYQTAARLGVTREELLSLVRRNCTESAID